MKYQTFDFYFFVNQRRVKVSATSWLVAYEELTRRYPKAIITDAPAQEGTGE